MNVRAVAAFAVLSGLLTLAVVYGLTHDPYDSYAEATVTRVEVAPGPPSSPIAQSKEGGRYHLEFATGTGSRVTVVHDRAMEGWRDFEAGAKVLLNYDPQDPKRYKITTPGERGRFLWQAGAVWLVINLIMAAGFARAGRAS